MTYKINDTVSYGNDGVCRVAEISEKDVGGTIIKYYILKPIYDEKSTIMVPLSNPKLLGKMKEIHTKEDVCAALKAACDTDPAWIADDTSRMENIRNDIVDGNITDLSLILKALYLHRSEQLSNGKRLHVADERAVKEIEKVLFDEFALVLNLQRSSVRTFFTEHIGLSCLV